nr:MAG: hypothetical protein [brine shrimp rhabdovirus 1]
MSNQVKKFVKSFGKDSPKKDQREQGEKGDPWSTVSTISDQPLTAQHTVRIESSLKLRTTKGFENLEECFGVLYNWLDNFRGVIESEFLTTSLFLCMGSNLTPRENSEKRILDANFSVVTFYNCLSEHPSPNSSWNTSVVFSVNNLHRKTDVEFSLCYKPTRMEGCPLEKLFKSDSNQFPSFRTALKLMKVEFLEHIQDNLVFTGKVF